MRRIFVLFLALLMLSGCAENAAPDLEQTQTTMQEEQEEEHLYVQGSPVEQQTKGAVTMFPLPDGEYTGFSCVGDRLLLKTGQDTPQLTILAGEQGTLSEPVAMPAGFDWDGVWQPTQNGLVYLDAENAQAVVLDSQLTEQKRIDLPEYDGVPVFTYDNSRIYYCKGQEIRAWEVELGIDRLIRTHSCQKQVLTGSYLAGKVISCLLTDENGKEKMLYINAENGQTLSEEQGVLSLVSGDKYYWASIQDGTFKQQVVGTLDGAAQVLMTDPAETLYSALPMNGILGVKAGENRSQHLSFYNLATGKKSAFVQIRGIGVPQQYLVDKWSNSVWFLADDPATNKPAMFRWKTLKSSLEEEANCVATWFDSENPDEEGIAQLKDRANDLGKTYGVNIRIWQDAVKETDQYILEAEHQTVVISAALDELEGILAKYPERFLSKSAANKIRICIVRSISREITGTQFWADSNPYILLSVGCDMENEFAKALGYVVTSRVLGNSTVMDSWQSLNPEGFQYGAAPDQSLLEGTTRAFVDAEAAKSVTEDRSRTFWMAIRPGNQAVFDSEIMQNKLQMMGNAVRDAYKLKKHTDVLPWEQYLKESIAYVKK